MKTKTYFEYILAILIPIIFLENLPKFYFTLCGIKLIDNFTINLTLWVALLFYLLSKDSLGIIISTISENMKSLVDQKILTENNLYNISNYISNNIKPIDVILLKIQTLIFDKIFPTYISWENYGNTTKIPNKSKKKIIEVGKSIVKNEIIRQVRNQSLFSPSIIENEKIIWLTTTTTNRNIFLTNATVYEYFSNTEEPSDVKYFDLTEDSQNKLNNLLTIKEKIKENVEFMNISEIIINYNLANKELVSNMQLTEII